MMTDQDNGREIRRQWDPQPGDYTRIREHLERQRDLPADRVRLDTGVIVVVGADAEGEDDEC
jgi:hypothetical protein